MVVVCACVAGGCRGPLFVLGPFVLAGDGLRGGALFGCFSRGFFICGKDHGLCSFFLLASSVRERERFIFLDNGQAACNWCCVWWLFVCFCQVFGPFIVLLILLI